MIRRLILLSGVAWAFVLLGVSPADAAPQGADAGCGTTVVDGADVLGADRPKVDAAAHRLRERGALVRVRTVGSVAGTDLDAAAEALETRCGWRVDGRRTSTLVLVMVAVDDRKTGIYYGTAWTTALRRPRPVTSRSV